MRVADLLKRLWTRSKGDSQYEEAEIENLLRDHDVAMTKVEHSNEEITQSQNKLLESIRLARPDEMRQMNMTMLERTKWRS